MKKTISWNVFVSCFLTLFSTLFPPSLASFQGNDVVAQEVKTPFFIEGQDPKPEGKTWTRVENLSDEFNGDTIDAAKWQTNPKGNGWGWIGRPPGFFDAKNVQAVDGKMKVTVSTLPEPLEINGQQFLYQGAIVRSIEPAKVGQYFETRMKANKTAMSSTFWRISKGGTQRQELDIQECVGVTTDKTAGWAKGWEQIFHSNLIRTEKGKPGKVQFQKGIKTPTANHERYYVYAAWWKSPNEVQFFLDGKYAYTLKPDVKWDLPAFIQMAIETYDWNPVPDGGGLIKTGTEEERSTQYDWVRVWSLE